MGNVLIIVLMICGVGVTAYRGKVWKTWIDEHTSEYEKENRRLK